MSHPHQLSIRVRYAESDQMGYAHHGAYVVWLEEARIAWLRDCGVSYRDLEASGTLMPVIACAIRYRAPLRFDDVIDLSTVVTPGGPSRLTFTTAITRAGTRCAEGTVTIAAVSREGKPMRMPAHLLPMISGA